MNASATADHARHAWRASSRSDLAPAFHRARRHSRWVRRLRMGIPTGMALLSIGYALLLWINPFGNFSALPSLAKLAISGSRITMDLPRLAGYTRDGRSYELTAVAAAQDLTRPTLIELQTVRAKVELKDGNRINITADAGVYDTKTEEIALRQNVVVVTSNGSEVRFNEARMDLRKGHVLSQEPVEVLLQDTRINAQQMEVTNAGDVVHFRGGVKMELRPEGPAAQTSSAEPSR